MILELAMSTRSDWNDPVQNAEIGQMPTKRASRPVEKRADPHPRNRYASHTPVEDEYRLLLDTLDEGFAIAEIDIDEQSPDAHMLAANSAATELLGTDLSDRSIRAADLDWTPGLAEAVGRVFQSGAPERVESYSAGLERWLEIRVSRMPVERDRFAIVLRDITERKATEAALGAELDAMNRLHELGAYAANTPNLSALLDRILDAAIALQNADFGNIQLYDSEAETLRIRAHRGFARSFLDRFAVVSAGSGSTCGMALAARARVCVEDVEQDPRCAEMLPAARESGFRALQSTPLISSTGEPLGMLSTHFRTVRHWSERELRHLDLVARQAASAIEHDRADEVLRESAARAWRALEIETVGILFHDADGRVRDANDAFLRMSGYTTQDLRAGRLHRSALIPPEWSPASRTVTDRLAAHGRAAPYEREYIRKDGSRWWGLVAPKLLDGGLTVEFVLDVTARRRVQEALRLSEGRFRAVANLVPDLLWRSDASGLIDWFNQRWTDYTGLPEESARGQDWLDVIHPDDREDFRDRFRRALHSGGSLMQEHRIRRWDGAYRWFLIRAEPVRDDYGRIADWFGSATDIHDERTAREVLEASVKTATAELHTLSRRLLMVQEEERRHLARELHDEIGQALTGLGFQLGIGDRLDEQRLTEARQIVQDLTNHVRGLSMELRPAALDKYGLLPVLRWHIDRYKRQTGIEIELRTEGAARRFSAPVEIAAFRIAQEALTNVARHSGSASAIVQIYADAAMLTVSIRDEGHGFDTGPMRGSSGLSGMRERAELMGGSLTIDSSPGAGVTVTAELPILEPESEADSR
jgi:PAS domain S-box-containing protein